MALGTFGAIMGFAFELVEYAINIYEANVEKSNNPVLKETLKNLLAEEKKNHSLIEQTRRENVTEMILEPITGLNQEDYKLDWKVPDQIKDIDLLNISLTLEEREKRFFYDALSKVPLSEVRGIFRKMAQRKEKNLNKLKTLVLN